jgi:hypothetical protein
MSLYYSELPPSPQAAYSQTLDHLLIRSLHRSVADLTGSFAKKTVAGKEYWYFQYRDIDLIDRAIVLVEDRRRAEDAEGLSSSCEVFDADKPL